LRFLNSTQNPLKLVSFVFSESNLGKSRGEVTMDAFRRQASKLRDQVAKQQLVIPFHRRN